MLEWRPLTGKLSVGRPPTRWTGDIKWETLETTGQELFIVELLKKDLPSLQKTCLSGLYMVLASVTDYKLSMSILILIITAPLIALCLIRSLKYLAPFSLVADLIIVTCVLTTITHGLLRFLGICIYSINGIGVTLPIENNMRRPVYFRAVLQWGMPFVVTLVMIIGFFGYWAWGEPCRSPFTVHMPSNTRRGVWERLYRTVYVFMISCLSIAFPNMSNWMSFSAAGSWVLRVDVRSH
ncbi:proton-coupled amino acid transporter-like protein pathetic [Pararge aegeria]|uniref:proton-coupled amino acid transporter-like protein pathetic n=1 Tax=Pararge aegeria TaxID=116150 RepID=UPI0019CF8FA8|nr:proton-coupled amino acid transporter-like protein pathetic [Pararge aegeria]